MMRKFFEEYKTNTAISLVELAVVIVIIGILATVVSAGSSLISQAKVRGVISEVTNYRLAYEAFQAQYDELPGDMTDNSAASWLGITNFSHGSSPAGDGYIGGDSEGPMAFWHMKLAELIEGDYDGECGDAEVPGVDIGYSKISSSYGFNFFSIGYDGNQWGYDDKPVYDINKAVVLAFGRIQPANGRTIPFAALSSLQAYNIDNKLDDGIPYTGQVLTDHASDAGNTSDCLDSVLYASAYVTDTVISYTRDDGDAACRMMFVLKY